MLFQLFQDAKKQLTQWDSQACDSFVYGCQRDLVDHQSDLNQQM